MGKKYSAVAFLGLIIIPFLALTIAPQRAYAQAGCILGGAAAGGAATAGGAAATAAPTGLPVKDISLNAISAANLTANTVVAANSTVENTVTCILNGLAWTVAKMTIQSLTRSTVNWINSGFQGSPAFVSDLQSNLKYLGDTVANDFFTNLNKEVISTTGFNITSPFQDQISQQLRAEYYRTTGSWGLNYTLNQSSKDPKAFINGDFSQGGYNAFFSASQNPANNPFGAYRLASNQLWSQIDAAAQQRKSELDWGKGFLPWRGSCSQSAGADLKNQLSLSKAEKCPFNSVKTPGSVIESQLENSLGSGIRQLELADSINEVVGALLGQLVNQVLGAGGLAGASQPSSGGGASYITQATDASQYDSINSSLSNGVIQNIKNDMTDVQQYQAHWQEILDEANLAQRTCGTRSEINSAISQANAAIARASTALAKINSIQGTVETAANSTAADKATRITSALADYQSYLSSSAVPNASEIADATAQSADTSNTDTTTPSLYTQMKNYANTCSSI